MQMKGKSKFEIPQKKDLRQEIYDAKKEIVPSKYSNLWVSMSFCLNAK